LIAIQLAKQYDGVPLGLIDQTFIDRKEFSGKSHDENARYEIGIDP